MGLFCDMLTSKIWCTTCHCLAQNQPYRAASWV